MAELTFILLWTVGFLWAFWGMHVLVMGIYRAHLSHRLKGLVLVLSLPFVAHELTQIKRQRVGGIGARRS